MHAYTHTYIHHTCTHAYMHTCIHATCIHACTYMQTYIHTHVHACIHTCMRLYVHYYIIHIRYIHTGVPGIRNPESGARRRIPETVPEDGPSPESVSGFRG